jgi:hypothetical protein
MNSPSASAFDFKKHDQMSLVDGLPDDSQTEGCRFAGPEKDHTNDQGQKADNEQYPSAVHIPV